MKKLVVVAALALALTGVAAQVSYAGPCADANCTPSENNKTGDASKKTNEDKYADNDCDNNEKRVHISLT